MTLSQLECRSRAAVATCHAYSGPASERARARHIALAGARRGALTLTLACLIVFLWTAASASAASGDVAWTRVWNGARRGTVSNAKTAARPGGGVYVAASLLRPSGNIDIVLLRYSAAGKRLWARSYDGAAHGLDWMKDLAVARDGSVLVCGSTFSRPGREDWVVLKYAPDGRRRWMKKVAGAYGRADVPEALAIASDGGVVVAGTLTRKMTGGDWCVVKFSAGGARLWRTTMTSSVAGLDQPLALAVDPKGGDVYATGRMCGSRSGDDAVTVRYRPDGRLVWRRRWDGKTGGPDRGAAIAVHGAGIAVAGVTRSPDTGDDGLVLRYARNGALRLEKTVDGGLGAIGIDAFAAVGIDHAGAVVAGGTIATAAARGGDATVVRFLPDGTQAGWWQLAGAGADEGILDLAVTAAGRTYAVGAAAGASSPDAIVAGLSGALTPLWPAVFYDRRGGDDQAQSVSLSGSAVYVAGVSGRDLFVSRVAR